MKFFQAFEEVNDTKIEKLFWIAGMTETSDFRDFLEEYCDDVIKAVFPENEIEFDPEWGFDELEYIFYCYKKSGLLAQVAIPVRSRFTFDGEKVTSSCYSRGHCYLEIVYADNMDDLLEQIKLASEKYYARDLERFKEKQND